MIAAHVCRVESSNKLVGGGDVVRSEGDRWYHAFSRVWRKIGRLAKTRCPSCGERSLNLVYVAEPLKELNPERTMFAFWCGSCLKGIPANTGPIPQGAEVVQRGEERVPHYKYVMWE